MSMDLAGEGTLETKQGSSTSDSRTGEEIIQLGEHRFQFGGVGDGFCYGHQSFDCLDNLTVEERTALRDLPY